LKSGTSKLSVGLVGFLQNKTPASWEPTHALVEFPENPAKPDHEPDQNPATKAADPAARTCEVVPDSRHPLVSPRVRAKIESIEGAARAKGWPAELLWNAGYWDSPRGLAAVLDTEDEIVDVTPGNIVILKTCRTLLRFRRHVA
jgi:hypothetical protein